MARARWARTQATITVDLLPGDQGSTGLVSPPQITMTEIDERRLQNPGQQHDRKRPADDDDRQRPLRLRADPCGNGGRQQPERVNQIGHHGGAQAPIGPHDDGFDERMAFIPELPDVKAEQDAVHDSDAENRDEPYRRGNAERGSGQVESEDTTEAGDRNLRHDY